MATTQQQRDQYLGLVVAGWVLAVYLPVAGVIVGAFLMNRREGHAIAMIAVSTISIMALVFAVLTLRD